MKILITGALGSIGRYTAMECLRKGHDVRLFDLKNPRTGRVARKFRARIRNTGDYLRRTEIVFGNLLNVAHVGEAMKGVDSVIHLAAVIPPQSERSPVMAKYINVTGTEILINAIKKQTSRPRLVFSSSVAVYGDRLNTPEIEVTDALAANVNDEYGKHKIESEDIIRRSDFVIFRLSAIFSAENLKMDPLMFEMPLDTSLEPCTAADAAFALAEAAYNPLVLGKTLHLAGGKSFRTTYREFLEKMMSIFGMGRGFLPEQAFSLENFHCGFMNTEESESLLRFQRATLDDFYREITSSYRVRRFFIFLVRPLARMVLLLKSANYVTYLKHLSMQGVNAARLFLKQMFVGRLLQH